MARVNAGQLIMNTGKLPTDARFQFSQFDFVDLACLACPENCAANFAIVDHLPGISRAFANLRP